MSYQEREELRRLAKGTLYLLDTVEDQRAYIDRLQQAVGFAKSVIKSGEGWSPTCEKMLDIDRLRKGETN